MAGLFYAKLSGHMGVLTGVGVELGVKMELEKKLG